jgi:epsilon-lactone hydrolase
MHLLERYSAKDIAIVGNSAGGGLAIATLFALKNMNLGLPAGGYLQSPWLDLTHSFPSVRDTNSLDYLGVGMLKNQRSIDRLHYYASDVDTKNPYVSPIWQNDLSKLPPLLIQCGSVERLYDEIVAFAKKYSLQNENGVLLEIYKVN